MLPFPRKIPPIPLCSTISPQSITEKIICYNIRFMVRYTQHIHDIKIHQNCITVQWNLKSLFSLGGMGMHSEVFRKSASIVLVLGV